MNGNSFVNHNESEQDFDLNIAPIIDCFTVLITYLLVAASFLSMGALDISISSTGASAENLPQPEIFLDVTLMEDKRALIRTTGGHKTSLTVSAKDGEYDLEAINAQVSTLKTKFSSLETVTVNVQAKVEYDPIIKVITKLKEVLPSIQIGEEP